MFTFSVWCTMLAIVPERSLIFHHLSNIQPFCFSPRVNTFTLVQVILHLLCIYTNILNLSKSPWRLIASSSHLTQFHINGKHHIRFSYLNHFCILAEPKHWSWQNPWASACHSEKVPFSPTVILSFNQFTSHRSKLKSIACVLTLQTLMWDFKGLVKI